jgi:hypothetical protein
MGLKIIFVSAIKSDLVMNPIAITSNTKGRITEIGIYDSDCGTLKYYKEYQKAFCGKKVVYIGGIEIIPKEIIDEVKDFVNANSNYQLPNDILEALENDTCNNLDIENKKELLRFYLIEIAHISKNDVDDNFLFDDGKDFKIDDKSTFDFVSEKLYELKPLLNSWGRDSLIPLEFEDGRPCYYIPAENRILSKTLQHSSKPSLNNIKLKVQGGNLVVGENVALFGKNASVANAQTFNLLQNLIPGKKIFEIGNLDYNPIFSMDMQPFFHIDMLYSCLGCDSSGIEHFLVAEYDHNYFLDTSLDIGIYEERQRKALEKFECELKQAKILYNFIRIPILMDIQLFQTCFFSFNNCLVENISEAEGQRQLNIIMPGYDFKGTKLEIYAQLKTEICRRIKKHFTDCNIVFVENLNLNNDVALKGASLRCITIELDREP